MRDHFTLRCRDRSGSERLRMAAFAVGCVLASAPATAQDADGDATVEVRQEISVVKNADLDFGSFIAGTGVSIFRMNPNNGTLTRRRGDATAVGNTTSVASFTATGTPLARIRLTNTQNRIDITRVGGTETMRVNRFRVAGGRNGRLDATGNATYLVAGQLRIRPDQAPGVYTGTFNVSVDYR